MSINIGYSIREAFSSFRRNWVMSMGGVVTIFLSLFIIGLFLVGGTMVDSIVKSIESKVSVQILLHDEAAQADVDSLRTWLEANPEVKSVGYTSKEQALENFKADMTQNPQIVEGLDGSNPLPASLDVELENPRSVQTLAAQILKNQTFLKVADAPDTPATSLKYGQQIVDRLFSVTRILRVVGYALVALLGVIALIFINNTIRLAIYSRRKEIGIMRLVGASNGFIRAPFLMEGALQAFLGALLAIGTIFAATTFLLPSVADAIPWMPVQITPGAELRIFAILLVAGVFIGLLGSMLAMRRYLRV